MDKLMNKEYRKLIIDQLPKRFNEGLFWGNGFIGGLLYVADHSLRFSVDSIQLWETRDSTQDMPAAKFADFVKNPELFHNGTYTAQTNLSEPRIWRSHLPGLSLNIALEDEITGFYAELDLTLASADIRVILKNGKQVNCCVYVDSNVNVLKVKLDAEQYAVEIKGWDTADGKLAQLTGWNYSRYTVQRLESINHVLQPYSGQGLAVISLMEKPGDIYITLNADTHVIQEKDTSRDYDVEADYGGKTDHDGEAGHNGRADHGERADHGGKIDYGEKTSQEMIAENTGLLEKYLEHEEVFREAHTASWAEFWSRFDLSVPNDRLQQAFYQEMYKIFSNERRGSWPVTLQGVWNNDAKIPAWYGDMHNDLNVQSCYWAAYKTNNIELAEAYIDYYTGAMPRLTERAYKLFGIKNAIHCPVQMAPEGYAAGGEWCFWNELLGPELFVAADFCWYYEYSRNLEKLESSVYPFIERVLNLYQGIAYPGEDGYYHIPFTNSPEVFRGPMLIKDDATVVISTLHYLLEHMERYAKLLGRDGSRYAEFNRRLTPVKLTAKGYPLFPDEDVFESHRHFCQLFPIFPLGTDIHSPTAERSLNAVIDLGLTEYAAWSFPYMSIFASRCGRGNMARTMLELYCMAFRARNTFVVNGDPYQNGILRVSDTNAGESSDAFTVEAGFIVPAALSEMFVHRSGDRVYIAYGIPDEWGKCSCRSMTIEGGHRISVVIEEYELKSVVVEPSCDEKVEFSFAKSKRPLMVDGNQLPVQDVYQVSLKKGRKLVFEVS